MKIKEKYEPIVEKNGFLQSDDKDKLPEIQPGWVAYKPIFGPIQIGECYDDTYSDNVHHTVKKTKMSVPSKSELEELARFSGLKVVQTGELDKDGWIEKHYKFEPINRRERKVYIYDLS